MLSTNIGRLRLLGYLEGISFLVLVGICVPLKHMYGMPKPTMYVGMVHGVLFMAYSAWVYIVQSEEKWNASKTFWAVIASLLPFGTFVADARLFRKQ